MKKLLLLYLIQSSILFCISITPQFNFIGNIGGSKTFTKTDVKHLDSYYMQAYSVYFDTIKGDIKFDTSLYMQLGFKIEISDKIAIGEFIEFGYSPYTINTKYDSKPSSSLYKYKNEDKILLHSIILGIIEKISFSKFNIGFGVGILIPISGYGTSTNPEKVYYSSTDYRENYSLVMPTKNKFNYDDVKRMFKTTIAPYIKLTAEYEFFPVNFKNTEMGFILGAYISYNFGMKFNVSELNKYLPRQVDYSKGSPYLDPLGADDIYYKYNFSNLDFGVIIGFSFKSYKS